MRKLFVILALLAVAVIALGLYRGWFTVSRPAPAAGNHGINVNLATDTDKMRADMKLVKDKSEQLTAQAKSGSAEPDAVPSDAEDAASSASRPQSEADADRATVNEKE